EGVGEAAGAKGSAATEDSSRPYPLPLCGRGRKNAQAERRVLPTSSPHRPSSPRAGKNAQAERGILPTPTDLPCLSVRSTLVSAETPVTDRSRSEFRTPAPLRPPPAGN